MHRATILKPILRGSSAVQIRRSSRRGAVSRPCCERKETDWEGAILDGRLMVHPDILVVSEEIKYQRYVTMYEKKIQLPPRNGQPGPVYDFDVAGHPKCKFHFSVVLPFHPYKDGRKGGEVTLCKEFAHGPLAMMYSLPTGGFEAAKHRDWVDTARCEMNEEVHLTGGQMLPLVPLDHPGIPEVKWCSNRFHPFLCIDPEQDPQPRPQDEEEFIEVLRVDMADLKQMAFGGNMLLPSVTTMFMAIEKLKELGHMD